LQHEERESTGHYSAYNDWSWLPIRPKECIP
jgi:hypothetical protein